MKTRPSRRQTANISHTRWLAYATAGAATALAGSNSAEAAIHYSGRLEVVSGGRFQLDQPGHSLFLFRGFGTVVGFGVYFSTRLGLFGGAFRAPSYMDEYLSVSKLSFGQKINTGRFGYPSYYGVLAGFHGGQWSDPGVGFIGFRFNSGAGFQYGWARVRMGGENKRNKFKLIDYAYADPGESIRAGQDGLKMSAEQGFDEGSLGGLALGAVGLLAWRKSRSRTVRQTRPPLPL